jgi:signal transduction histidine kinase
MSKKVILSILALMTLGLLGLIGVQLYWLEKAAILKERLFRASVSRALNSVAQRLEYRETQGAIARTLLSSMDTSAARASSRAPSNLVPSLIPRSVQDLAPPRVNQPRGLQGAPVLSLPPLGQAKIMQPASPLSPPPPPVVPNTSNNAPQSAPTQASQSSQSSQSSQPAQSSGLTLLTSAQTALKALAAQAAVEQESSSESRSESRGEGQVGSGARTRTANTSTIQRDARVKTRSQQRSASQSFHYSTSQSQSRSQSHSQSHSQSQSASQAKSDPNAAMTPAAFSPQTAQSAQSLQSAPTQAIVLTVDGKTIRFAVPQHAMETAVNGAMNSAMQSVMQNGVPPAAAQQLVQGTLPFAFESTAQGMRITETSLNRARERFAAMQGGRSTRHDGDRDSLLGLVRKRAAQPLRPTISFSWSDNGIVVSSNDAGSAQQQAPPQGALQSPLQAPPQGALQGLQQALPTMQQQYRLRDMMERRDMLEAYQDAYRKVSKQLREIQREMQREIQRETQRETPTSEFPSGFAGNESSSNIRSANNPRLASLRVAEQQVAQQVEQHRRAVAMLQTRDSLTTLAMRTSIHATEQANVRSTGGEDNANSEKNTVQYQNQSKKNLAAKPAMKPLASLSQGRKSANATAPDTLESIVRSRADLIERTLYAMTLQPDIRKRVRADDLHVLIEEALRENDVTMPFDFVVHKGTEEEAAALTNTASKAASTPAAMVVLAEMNENENVHDGGVNVNPHKSHSTMLQAVMASDFAVRLFPHDLIGKAHTLRVHFPSYQAASMLTFTPAIASSGVFLLMVIGCFMFTMVSMMQQKKLSDMKTDFINNMTHELKTPIATISIASEALKDSALRTNAERVERFVGIIHDENKRLAGHVEKVLQAAQMERGELKLSKSVVDIHALLDETKRSLELQIEQRGGQIQCDFHATNTVLEIDKAHIANVLINLLDNAAKYSPEYPHIRIQTRSDAKHLTISVADNGIGITKEAQKHIFEKFYRVATGNRHDVKGFGLGLSYVKSIVETHGGTIAVASELGKGTTFELQLPYTPAPQSTPAFGTALTFTSALM